jgi:hypothetical protein
MISGLPTTSCKFLGAPVPRSLRRISPKSKRVNSIKPEGPIAWLTVFSTSGYVFAEVTSLRNALISGWPIAASSRDTTSWNDLDEITLNRCTWIGLVAI